MIVQVKVTLRSNASASAEMTLEAIARRMVMMGCDTESVILMRHTLLDGDSYEYNKGTSHIEIKPKED